MAHVVTPRTSSSTPLFGAAGGLVASLAGLAVLCLLSVVEGATAYRPLNAIGAWTVRWLQSADQSALDQFLSDATPAGLIYSLVLGCLVGAVFAGLCRRLSDSPVALGLGFGLLVWAITQWQLAPALDPVILRALRLEVLLAAFLNYGLVLGAWTQAGLPVIAEAPHRDDQPTTPKTPAGLRGPAGGPAEAPHRDDQPTTPRTPAGLRGPAGGPAEAPRRDDQPTTPR